MYNPISWTDRQIYWHSFTFIKRFFSVGALKDTVNIYVEVLPSLSGNRYNTGKGQWYQDYCFKKKHFIYNKGSNIIKAKLNQSDKLFYVKKLMILCLINYKFSCFAYYMVPKRPGSYHFKIMTISQYKFTVNVVLLLY